MKEVDLHLLEPAAKDYRWMLDRGYPQVSSLKLVGDRYKLKGEFRQVLYRGISSFTEALERSRRKGEIQRGDRIGVDAYNVLFTVNNYLLGKHVFICNDGFLRDAGEMRGRIVKKPVFERSVELLLESLGAWDAVSFQLWLDEPVSHSADLAAYLSGEMEKRGINGKAGVDRSPDQKLIDEETDVVCSSDSVVIHRSQGRVFDLARYLLEKNFTVRFADLGDICDS